MKPRKGPSGVARGKILLYWGDVKGVKVVAAAAG